MPNDRLHITLHSLGRFLNGVPREVLDLALAAGGAMDYEPFGVSLNLLQSRGGGGAGTLGTVELAAQAGAARELRGFQRALGNTMRRMGFGESQIRSHFNPHMTLHYQHQGIGRTTVAPITWTAMQFALVDSLYGLGRPSLIGDAVKLVDTQCPCAVASSNESSSGYHPPQPHDFSLSS